MKVNNFINGTIMSVEIGGEKIRVAQKNIYGAESEGVSYKLHPGVGITADGTGFPETEGQRVVVSYDGYPPPPGNYQKIGVTTTGHRDLQQNHLCERPVYLLQD